MLILRYSLVALMLAAGTAHAGVVVEWSFDGATNPPNESDTAIAPTVDASTGTGSATGVHSSDASDWTTPTGNGTSDAFGANNWAVGDYFAFNFSAAGYYNLVFDFDQTSSTNGPKDFKIQTSNGSGFIDLDSGTYSVLRNGVPNPLWTAITYQPLYHFSFTVPDGTSDVRIVVTDTVSASNGTILPTGASRLDSVIIAGTPVPEPASICLALLGLGGLFMGARRRIIR